MFLPFGAFYNLKSATTRPMREKESEGNPYYFRDETYFDVTPLATRLWVNEQFWQPGIQKWMYGVPEFEIWDNCKKNLVYDVIEPKYAQQLFQWFCRHGLDQEYIFKTLYFIPSQNSMKIAEKRANMPNDMEVRRVNTCEPIDFLRAGLHPDYLVLSNKAERIIPPALQKFLDGYKAR